MPVYENTPLKLNRNISQFVKMLLGQVTSQEEVLLKFNKIICSVLCLSTVYKTDIITRTHKCYYLVHSFSGVECDLNFLNSYNLESILHNISPPTQSNSE
uniref:Uncharacterized protein n=1 Tax=Anguilla anguilla TaxID=7936 RepID=A0A0E9RWU4_ANGAN